MEATMSPVVSTALCQPVPYFAPTMTKEQNTVKTNG